MNTPIHTIMMWTMLILMFILDMSIHILLNMHFLKDLSVGLSVWRKTGSCAGKDNISDAPNGSTQHIKSVVKKELSQSSSNLVFGYLNHFYDGVHNFTDGIALGSAFLLYGSIGGVVKNFVSACT